MHEVSAPLLKGRSARDYMLPKNDYGMIEKAFRSLFGLKFVS